MSVTEALFSFQGRMKRLPYFGYSLLTGAIAALIGFGGGMLVESGRQGGAEALVFVGGLLAILALIIVFWASLALQVKRLHDLNISGYFIILIILLSAFIGAGSHYAPAMKYLDGIVDLILFVLFVFVPGTAGTNKYG